MSLFPHGWFDRRVMRRDVNLAFREVAALEWELQAMREDDSHPDFDVAWVPMRLSVVAAAIALARALRRLETA